MKANAGRLFHFACFSCRRSFKRSIESDGDAFLKRCPNCTGTAVQLGRDFKPPPSSDLDQWQKVRFLVEHGFFFHRVRDASGARVPYPATLADARAFVVRYKAEAWAERIPDTLAVLPAA